MAGKILKWKDNKFEELNGDEPLELAKVFRLGAIEGFIDGLVVVGAGYIITGIVEFIKDFKK